MSLSSGSGITIATVVVSGVLFVFVIPLLSYALLLGFAHMLSPMSYTCDQALIGGCYVERKTISTSYGSVELNITRLPNISMLATIGNVAQDLLLSLLVLFSRIEVMSVAFALDLVMTAYEYGE